MGIFVDLHIQEEIAYTIEYLGESLFDQTVNNRETIVALAQKYATYANVIAIFVDDRLVGLSAYYDNKDTAFISMFVVDSKYQGKGYGTALLKEVIRRCKGKPLSLKVSPLNTGAIRFYEKMGFKKVDKDSMVYKADIEKEIIDFIKRNRVSTTEVADCLGKKGSLPGLVPCTMGYHRVGIIKWVYAHNESNWSLHEQIQNIQDGNLVFVDAYNCGDRAILGHLISKFLLLYHQSEAIVVQGKVRDAAELIREKWPIWCRGYTPVGCFNEKSEYDIDESWVEEHNNYYDGAIAVCDDCGVVVVPKDCISEVFLERLYQIEEQEDIWFDRLDHYKDNTFSIVCKRDYLNDQAYMSTRLTHISDVDQKKI